MIASSHPFWEAIYVRNYLSLGAVICLIWETIVTLPFEISYIWRSRWTPVKILYLLMRYIALIGQTTNHIWASKLLASAPITSSECRKWFAFQAALVQALIHCVELTMMLRVWALYNRRKKIGCILLSLFTVEFVTMVICSFRVNRGFTFNSTCLLLNTPAEIAISAIVLVISQTTTYAMTIYQQKSEANHGLKGNQLMGLLTRDGGVVLGTLFLCHTLTIPYTLFVQQLPHNTFTLFIVLLSIIGCRLIQNLQTLKPPEETAEFALSTLISTNDIPNDEFEFGEDS